MEKFDQEEPIIDAWVDFSIVLFSVIYSKAMPRKLKLVTVFIVFLSAIESR